jgi:hypothetical protein
LVTFWGEVKTCTGTWTVQPNTLQYIGWLALAPKNYTTQKARSAEEGSPALRGRGKAQGSCPLLLEEPTALLPLPLAIWCFHFVSYGISRKKKRK